MKNHAASKNCKRGSRQRRLILDTVRSGALGHPTAAEVYDAVRGKMPNISLGTVYRNLGSLASDGEITRLDLGDVSRFDCDTSEHSHFACKKCGAIFDVRIRPSARRGLLSSLRGGFSADSASVLFSGYCPKCSKKLQPNTKENRL